MKNHMFTNSSPSTMEEQHEFTSEIYIKYPNGRKDQTNPTLEPHNTTLAAKTGRRRSTDWWFFQSTPTWFRRPFIQALHSLYCKNYKDVKASAIREKYSRREYCSVANIGCPENIPGEYF